MIRLLPRSPWLPIAILLAAAVVGGWLNTVNAHGVVINDVNQQPVQPQDVFYASRHYTVGPDGVYDLPNLPRGAKFTVVAAGWTRYEASATLTQVLLSTAIITVNVKDAETGEGIKYPQARVGNSSVGSGTDSGIMTVAPAPPKDTPILVCADGYESTTFPAAFPEAGVRLKKPGPGCPAEPTPSPSPSGSPAGSPSPSSAPSPAPAPSPTPSP